MAMQECEKVTGKRMFLIRPTFCLQLPLPENPSSPKRMRRIQGGGNRSSKSQAFSFVAVKLLDAQKKHLSRAGFAHVGVEHCVI